MKRRKLSTAQKEELIRRVHVLLDEIGRELRNRENLQRGRRAARKEEK